MLKRSFLKSPPPLNAIAEGNRERTTGDDVRAVIEKIADDHRVPYTRGYRVIRTAKIECRFQIISKRQTGTYSGIPAVLAPGSPQSTTESFHHR
jgi:hypothetical protein